MTLAITICSTSSYTYAMGAQARRVAANVRQAGVEPGHIILVGDAAPAGKNAKAIEPSEALRRVQHIYEAVMPEGWKISVICNPAFQEGGENYKEQAQLLIAAMREDAFTAARKLGADYCWSLDSDVLPPVNALQCSLDMLRFDGGRLYSVASCPYPNALWLGGRGTYRNPIAEDFLPGERKVPWKLKRALEACEKRLSRDMIPSVDQVPARWMPNRPVEGCAPEFRVPPTREGMKKVDELLARENVRLGRLRERLKACPPDGTVWDVISKHGWRQRGWLDFAYPGIGHGAVVPSDWCGFGCTLMDRRALEAADFVGYDGRGTEDLFVVWNRWRPAGLRICCITHCPCSHVIWQRKKVAPGKATATEIEKAAGSYVLLDAYHEHEGECVGHLRYAEKPWVPEWVRKPAS